MVFDLEMHIFLFFDLAMYSAVCLVLINVIPISGEMTMKMNEVMNYLLEWTLKQCQGGENALFIRTCFCSPEVYDRAVSIIRYCCTLFCLVVGGLCPRLLCCCSASCAFSGVGNVVILASGCCALVLQRFAATRLRIALRVLRCYTQFSFFTINSGVSD